MCTSHRNPIASIISGALLGCGGCCSAPLAKVVICLLRNWVIPGKMLTGSSMMGGGLMLLRILFKEVRGGHYMWKTRHSQLICKLRLLRFHHCLSPAVCYLFSCCSSMEQIKSEQLTAEERTRAQKSLAYYYLLSCWQTDRYR